MCSDNLFHLLYLLKKGNNIQRQKFQTSNQRWHSIIVNKNNGACVCVVIPSDIVYDDAG